MAQEISNNNDVFIRGKILSGFLSLVQAFGLLLALAGVSLFPQGYRNGAALQSYVALIVLILLGLMYFATANALWRGKKWGFFGLIIAFGISVITNFLGSNIIQSIVFFIIIIAIVALVKSKYNLLA